ncbi:MAG: peptidylprolyl isomerase [Ignavibacteriaceae bacterium]|nr:peptidylprolyl isomerase [Ignavibacteriaceae bacterium]
MIKYIILLFNFILISQIKAQTDDEVIAKIGNIPVTRKEFVQRYEMMPQLDRQMKGITEQLKEEFLYGIIFEKLFAQAALEQKLDTVEITSYSLHEFEKMFVRDALYNKEVSDKAKGKSQMLLSQYLSNATKVFAQALFSKDEKEMKNYSNLLSKGLPFDSLLVELPEQSKDTITFEIGMEDENLERQIFSLPENANTTPIHLEDGWYIYHIIKRYEPILEKSKGWESEYQQIKKVAHQRAEREFFIRYMKKIFLNKKVEAKASLLKLTGEKMVPLLQAKEKKDKKDKLYLSSDDFYTLEHTLLADSVSKVFIKLEKKEIPLKNFIRFLNFDDPGFTSSETKHVLSILNAKTKEFIEREVLAEEGYKQKLEQTKEVKESFGMWRDFLLHQAMQSAFLDSAKVSDDEVAAYYAKRNAKKESETLVNIIEILTNNLETVDTVLQKLKEGVDIKILAGKYSQREITKNSSGEFGFFPTTSFGDIGRIAGSLNIGETYGPLKVPEGFSIFKLIDKKKPKFLADEEFAVVKEKLKRDLAFNKLRNSIIKYSVDLARKYGITINDNILQATPVTNLNSVVYRYIGFGGKITAVPMMTPFTDWVEQWKKNSNTP